MIASVCELLPVRPVNSALEVREFHPPDVVIVIPPEVASLPHAIERVREYLEAQGVSVWEVHLPCQWREIGAALGLDARVVERKIEELRNELSDREVWLRDGREDAHTLESGDVNGEGI